VSNTTFNNISAIFWQSSLMVEENVVARRKITDLLQVADNILTHKKVVSSTPRNSLTHQVVSSTPRYRWASTNNFSSDRH